MMTEPKPRPNLETLYVALDAAVAAVADLVTVAQAVLPDDISRDAFVALQCLAALKITVNPGPTEEDPF